MNTDLIRDLGKRGESLLKDNLRERESVFVKLKGSFGEGLVISDQGVYVLKWGFMAGNTFGGRCNAFPFNQIISLEIKKGLATGTFEVLTAATQNAQKTYWGRGQNSAIKSDNIVTFNRRKQFMLYQEAVNVGREAIAKAHSGMNSPNSELDDLEKLAALKEKGIITDDEFAAKKKTILGL